MPPPPSAPNCRAELHPTLKVGICVMMRGIRVMMRGSHLSSPVLLKATHSHCLTLAKQICIHPLPKVKLCPEQGHQGELLFRRPCWSWRSRDLGKGGRSIRKGCSASAGLLPAAAMGSFV